MFITMFIVSVLLGAFWVFVLLKASRIEAPTQFKNKQEALNLLEPSVESNIGGVVILTCTKDSLCGKYEDALVYLEKEHGFYFRFSENSISYKSL